MSLTRSSAETSQAPPDAAIGRWGRSRLATPENPQGFFKGILHEVAHAAFWATHGVGFAYAERKAGIMALGSPVGIWPTEVDVASVRAFVRGRNLIKH